MRIDDPNFFESFVTGHDDNNIIDDDIIGQLTDPVVFFIFCFLIRRRWTNFQRPLPCIGHNREIVVDNGTVFFGEKTDLPNTFGIQIPQTHCTRHGGGCASNIEDDGDGDGGWGRGDFCFLLLLLLPSVVAARFRLIKLVPANPVVPLSPPSSPLPPLRVVLPRSIISFVTSAFDPVSRLSSVFEVDCLIIVCLF